MLIVTVCVAAVMGWVLQYPSESDQKTSSIFCGKPIFMEWLLMLLRARWLVIAAGRSGCGKNKSATARKVWLSLDGHRRVSVFEKQLSEFCLERPGCAYHPNEPLDGCFDGNKATKLVLTKGC
jgi:hypothetical protein